MTGVLDSKGDGTRMSVESAVIQSFDCECERRCGSLSENIFGRRMEGRKSMYKDMNKYV